MKMHSDSPTKILVLVDMFEDKKCMWSLIESCSLGRCSKSYSCGCREGFDFTIDCSQRQHCTQAACMSTCPKWGPWSLCTNGQQYRHRICACGVSDGSSTFWQDGKSCWEWRICSLEDATELTPIDPEAGPSVVGPTVVLTITCFLFLLFLILLMLYSRKKRRMRMLNEDLARLAKKEKMAVTTEPSEFAPRNKKPDLPTIAEV